MTRLSLRVSAGFAELVTEVAGGLWRRSKFSSGSPIADDDDDNDNDRNKGKDGNGLSGVLWKTPTHNNGTRGKDLLIDTRISLYRKYQTI